MLRSCKMRVTVLRNGTRVPKSGFAAVKSFAKWSFPCENGIFHALVVRSHFAAAKWKSLCWEMALVCQSWFRSCETPCGMELWLRNWDFSRFGTSQPFRSCEMGVTVLRNGTHVPKLGFAVAKIFAERGLRLRNLADPYFPPVFALFFLRFCSKRLSFNFFAIPPDFDHPKTYITSKQIRIKALKSKLKQVKKQNKKIWTS